MRGIQLFSPCTSEQHAVFVGPAGQRSAGQPCERPDRLGRTDDDIGRRMPLQSRDDGRQQFVGMSAQRGKLVGGGRIIGQELHRDAPRAERHRHRHIGQLVRSRRDLERTSADVEHEDLPGRPAEPSADREEGVPRLAGSVEHLQGSAGDLFDLGDRLGAVRRFAQRRGRDRQERLDILLAGDTAGFGRGIRQRIDALATDRAIRFEVAHEPQHPAKRRRGRRTVTRSSVGDEQVDGVRTDIENSQAHGLRLSACSRERVPRPGATGRGVVQPTLRSTGLEQVLEVALARDARDSDVLAHLVRR